MQRLDCHCFEKPVTESPRVEPLTGGKITGSSRKLVHTEHMVREDWIPYRVQLLGNYGANLTLKREINCFLVAEDPFGRGAFVRFGLERSELRDDLDVETIVSFLDWVVERFQDALLAEE